MAGAYCGEPCDFIMDDSAREAVKIAKRVLKVI
jgi:hypothetical protein